jgi:hypothetical protein
MTFIRCNLSLRLVYIFGISVKYGFESGFESPITQVQSSNPAQTRQKCKNLVYICGKNKRLMNQISYSETGGFCNSYYIYTQSTNEHNIQDFSKMSYSRWFQRNFFFTLAAIMHFLTVLFKSCHLSVLVFLIKWNKMKKCQFRENIFRKIVP